MIIKTRVFELYNGNYRNLSELAQAMELSVSQVYRVREGKRSINQKFIIGAKKPFPIIDLKNFSIWTLIRDLATRQGQLSPIAIIILLNNIMA